MNSIFDKMGSIPDYDEGFMSFPNSLKGRPRSRLVTIEECNDLAKPLLELPSTNNNEA